MAIYTFDIGIYPTISIPVWSNFRLSLFGGPALQWGRINDQVDHFFNGRHPGVAETINNMDEAMKTMFLSFAYGFNLEYKRLHLSIRQIETAESFTRDINIYGTDRPFKNDFKKLTLSIGYKFYSFKIKNKP